MSSIENSGHNLHGKILKYEGLKSLSIIPKRADLLDKAMVDDMNSTIEDTSNDRLMFLPNSFEEIHEKKDGVLRYNILIVLQYYRVHT